MSQLQVLETRILNLVDDDQKISEARAICREVREIEDQVLKLRYGLHRIRQFARAGASTCVVDEAEALLTDVAPGNGSPAIPQPKEQPMNENRVDAEKLEAIYKFAIEVCALAPGGSTDGE